MGTTKEEPMSARYNRGNGIPLTDEERQQRHFDETGEWVDIVQLPARGTGLATQNPATEGIGWLKTNWQWLLGIGLAVGAIYYWYKHKG